MYHERWELKLGYDEIKTDMLERLEAIRSKPPDRVRQEIWGLAVGYNLIRREMELAAGQWGVSPRRISFRGSLRLIRDLFVWAEVASPGALPKMLKRVEDGRERLDIAAKTRQPALPQTCQNQDERLPPQRRAPCLSSWHWG